MWSSMGAEFDIRGCLPDNLLHETGFAFISA